MHGCEVRRLSPLCFAPAAALLAVLPRAGIHEACLCKKTDLKTDSFQTLFINAFLVVYPTFYRTDLSSIIFLTFNAIKFLPAVNG
jgi:hypothetical protein